MSSEKDIDEELCLNCQLWRSEEVSLTLLGESISMSLNICLIGSMTRPRDTACCFWEERNGGPAEDDTEEESLFRDTCEELYYALGFGEQEEGQ